MVQNSWIITKRKREKLHLCKNLVRLFQMAFSKIR